MDKADDDGNTPSPQKVLDVLHSEAVSKNGRVRKRIPQVTDAIEALTQQLKLIVLTDLAGSLGPQALAGLKQFTDAVAAYRPRLEDAIVGLPLLDPRGGRLHEDFRTLSRARPFWHKMAATDFFQSASLMLDDPLDPSPRKDLAIMQTMVFAGVSLVFEQSGLRVGTADNSIACRATAELIKRFTSHDHTTAAAVGSAARRQLAAQDKALSDLGEGIKKGVTRDP